VLFIALRVLLIPNTFAIRANTCTSVTVSNVPQ